MFGRHGLAAEARVIESIIDFPLALRPFANAVDIVRNELVDVVGEEQLLPRHLRAFQLPVLGLVFQFRFAKLDFLPLVGGKLVLTVHVSSLLAASAVA